MSKLIIGCGYLGQRVARRWRDAGHDVFVVTRSEARSRELADEGYCSIVADVLRPETLADLPVADSVLFAVGYDRRSNASIHETYAGGLAHVLDALPAETGRLIYISSTGVYGQTEGEIVDERSATEPSREGGRASLAAEQTLWAHPLGQRGVVLRLAGIYGPGRIPLVAKICAGEPIPAPERGWLNLIHVDDACSVVLAAAERAEPPQTYLVSDGHAIERRAYYQELARLVGVPPPVFATPAPDSSSAARATSNKRVSNERMQAELNVALAYPTYREGLSAILAAENEDSAEA